MADRRRHKSESKAAAALRTTTAVDDAVQTGTDARSRRGQRYCSGPAPQQVSKRRPASPPWAYQVARMLSIMEFEKLLITHRDDAQPISLLS